jgi:hypothetical protein
VIRLGPIELTAHITAGHTPGCTHGRSLSALVTVSYLPSTSAA